jgi:hypothetical protein
METEFEQKTDSPVTVNRQEGIQEPECSLPERIRSMKTVDDFDLLNAAGTFQRMGTEEFQALVAVFERENRKKPRRFWTAFVIWVAAVAICIALIEGLLHWLGWKNAPLGGAAGGLSMPGLGIGAAVASTRLQRRIAEVLLKYEDVAVVGPLAEMLDRQDAATRKMAEQTLIRLLPRLRPTDAGLLNETQRAALYRELSGRNWTSSGRWRNTLNTALLVAILRALEQVGSGEALPHVERLAGGKGQAKRNLEIREAAKACLPFLQERVELERLSRTLLRPAESPEAPAAILLRPAQGVPDADPNILLRPAISEENEE